MIEGLKRVLSVHVLRNGVQIFTIPVKLGVDQAALCSAVHGAVAGDVMRVTIESSWDGPDGAIEQLNALSKDEREAYPCGVAYDLPGLKTSSVDDLIPALIAAVKAVTP